MVVGTPFALVMSFLAQFCMAFYMLPTVLAGGDQGGDFDASCGGKGGATFLRMISSYIFVAIVFKDLLETYDMYLWMRMFPIIEEHEEFKMQQFLDKSMDDIYEGTLISSSADLRDDKIYICCLLCLYSDAESIACSPGFSFGFGACAALSQQLRPHSECSGRNLHHGSR